MFRHRFLITAVMLALAATILTNTHIRRLEEQASGQGARMPVVVAKTAIPRGTPLKQSHVTTRWWPPDMIPQGTVADPLQVEGHVAAVDFVAGEAIITSRLLDEGEQSLSWRLSPGERAVAVQIRGVEGLESELAVGRRVDILGTFLDYSTGLENSVMVLENVKLLDAALKEHAFGGSLGTQTVVLAVSPKEAQKLALFSSSGTLQLLLRPEVEQGDAGPQQVVLTTLDLLGSGTGGWAGRSGTSSLTSRTAAGRDSREVSQKTVEVIRGTASSTVDTRPAALAFR